MNIIILNVVFMMKIIKNKEKIVDFLVFLI